MRGRAAVLVALAACGDDASPPGSDLQLAMHATVPAGAERTMCQYFELPEGFDVARFAHHYTPGSHHVLLYPTLLEALPQAGAFPCDGADVPISDLFVDGVAYGDQKPDGELALPDGVAYRFDTRVVLMQAHYLNASDAALDAHVRIDLWAPPAPPTTLAGTLFFYHPAIDLHPAPATSTAAMRCTIDREITLLLGVSHMHRRGTAFRSVLESAGAEPRTLHSTADWNAPTPTTFSPPVVARAGDAIRFACDYQNDLPTTVIEGSSAVADEMCVFAVPYYPKGSKALESCTGPTSGAIFAGTRTCAQTIDCLDATAPFDDAGHLTRLDCMYGTCPGSSVAANNMFDRNCYGCAAGTFTGCAPTDCPDEWAACQAATCP